MINLLLILILAWQFYIGYNRGIILQGFYTLASFVALFVASLHYSHLAQKLSLWIPYANPSPDSHVLVFSKVNLFDLDHVFYNGFAFVSLYLITYTIFRFLGIFVQGITWDRLQAKPYAAIAGGLSVLVTSGGISLMGNLVATIPYAGIQDKLVNTGLLKLFIHFPIFSQLVENLWLI